MDLRATLEDAVGTGQIIRVRYYGGSQAGSVRDLQVHSVDGDLVKAVCLETEAFKVFRVDRMELAPDAPLSYDRASAKKTGKLRMRMLRPKRDKRQSPIATQPSRPNFVARIVAWLRGYRSA